MRLRITLVAATITAVAVGIAGWLLLRSVEDTQVASIRDRARQSIDLAAARLDAGRQWEEALVDLPGVVVVTDGEGACMVSNPIGDRFDFRCRTDGQPAIGFDDGSDGTGVPEESVVSIGSIEGEPFESEVRVGDIRSHGDAMDAGSGDAMYVEGIPDEVVDDEMVFGVRPALVLSDRLTTTVETDRYGVLSVTAMAPADTVVGGLRAVGWIVWVLFPALVLLAAGLAWWLAGRTLRPVEAIRSEADEIGATSLDRRVPQPAADDEIGRLATTMNSMLDRLERGAQQHRQFISDASHELRSPVAAIRTDLEVALEEGDAADWPATASAVLAEEARLDALIGDLLILAADDEGGGQVGDDVVDLDLVVAEAAARRRRIPTRVTIEPGRTFVVRGSASRLQRALANLLDNAARHGDARVDFSIVADGERVIVSVDDDGPGVDPADRERVFERFTRLDEGRARDQGGAGLGLAVARAIVERHGGSVSVGDSPLGGARFTVDLPRS